MVLSFTNLVTRSLIRSLKSTQFWLRKRGQTTDIATFRLNRPRSQFSEKTDDIKYVVSESRQWPWLQGGASIRECIKIGTESQLVIQINN